MTASGTAAGAPGPLLSVDGLRTWFDVPGGTARAVDGVSFDVAAGESVGLVGESGCGKTVTCLSLLGLVPEPGRIVDGSSVRLDGRELLGADEDELRRVRGRRIGMVFQEPATALNPVLRVGDQVAEVVRAHLGGDRRSSEERAVELLEEVGLDDPRWAARAYPHQLSGGMKQRAVIAGALAAEPDLLVADEPTTALDVTVQARILDLLAAIRERRGMALLLVTHDLAVVSELCDRILVMYAGEIVERASTERLFRDPVHPYTRALLHAAAHPVGEPPLGETTAGEPTDGRPVGERRRLRTIPGSVPPAHAWPPGCRFAERCPSAWTRCRAQHPPLLDCSPRDPGGEPAAGGMRHATRREARCWLVEEPERRRDP